jgi:hypothetical protein
MHLDGKGWAGAVGNERLKAQGVGAVPVAGVGAGDPPIILHADEKPAAGASGPVRQTHYRLDDVVIGERALGFAFQFHVHAFALLNEPTQLFRDHLVLPSSSPRSV